MIILFAAKCTTKSSSVEDTVKDYYSSINKNNFKGTNPNMIAGWAEKTDNDKQYLEEFQLQIAEFFKQHQGLKEVKIVESTPGGTEAEASVDIQLICNDGHIEAVSHQLVKEGDAWKIMQ
jgi:hypothetical protein